MAKQNYYVFGITYGDMCCFSHSPVRAKNPQHAEEKFLGSMGLKKAPGHNYAERVTLWRHRNKAVTNLLRRISK
jgi:hypothetical protein